jgi:hypothetical protein
MTPMPEPPETDRFNPYQPPAAQDPPPGDATPAGPRIRPRLIPATFCAALGSIALLGAVAWTVFLVVLFRRHGWVRHADEMPGLKGLAHDPWNLLAILGYAAGGLFGWAAARSWAKGHWGRAVLQSVAMYVLVMLVVQFFLRRP